jgi:ribosomal protein L11 methyltransferase
MFELCLTCAQFAVDPLEQALQEAGAVCITWEDPLAGTPEEEALFGEPGSPHGITTEFSDDMASAPPSLAWARTRLIALFDDQTKAEQAIQHLQALPVWQEAKAHCVREVIRCVPDLDWVQQTQSQFQPIAITADFWVVPSWHETPSQAKTQIRLDPGLAFGTGTHPTTALCLRWLAAHMPVDLLNNQGKRPIQVLDYGCGSGILAIGAALLGGQAVVVDAVDIDPQAVQATRDNAQTNGVQIQVGLPDTVDHALSESLESPAPSTLISTPGRYDLVIANILSRPLQVLAPLLCAYLKPGGQLLLSGILTRQAEEIALSYAPYLPLSVTETQEGWVLMNGIKPTIPSIPATSTTHAISPTHP